MQMIKGDYSSGCKNCGQIIATFKWGKDTDINSFLLTGLSVSDNQLKMQTESALMSIRTGNFAEGYPIILKAAEGNYLLAQHTLGLMLVNGDGVKKDYKAASYWFARAAGGGYPPALYDLGAMYRNGEGMQANINAAKDLYTQAANLGYILAMQELIKIYSEEGDQQQADFGLKDIRLLQTGNKQSTPFSQEQCLLFLSDFAVFSPLLLFPILNHFHFFYIKVSFHNSLISPQK